SSCKRPIRGYLQAEPGMPRVIDLQFGTMGFLSRGCITNLARISPWSEILRHHEKSNLRQRARSSPFHKSAACIIDIVGPPNFGAVADPRDNSTRIDHKRIASKGLVRLITNRVSAERNTNCDFEVEIGFGATNIRRFHPYDGLFTMHKTP